jgi:hypothetical protein
VFQPFTPVRLKERRRPNWSVLLLAGLVAVLGIAGFKLLGSHNNNKARSTASTSVDHSHKAKPSPSVTPVVHAKPKHVHILLVAKAGAITWAELTTASGQVVYNGDVGQSPYPPQMSWTEPHTVTLSLGNPAGAAVYLNGVRQPLRSTNPVILTCTRAKCTGG